MKSVILLFNFIANDDSEEQQNESSGIPVLYIAVPTGNEIMHCSSCYF